MARRPKCRTRGIRRPEVGIPSLGAGGTGLIAAKIPPAYQTRTGVCRLSTSTNSASCIKIIHVPTISRFLGIAIMINFNEHDPPHFHARYGRAKISVRIADGVVTGQFPARALAHVLEWWNLHRAELAENWHLARQHSPLRNIEPLE